MGKYKVTLNYLTSFSTIVEAHDEGEAYTLARNEAEDADMNQFQLGVERESQCNCVE